MNNLFSVCEVDDSLLNFSLRNGTEVVAIEAAMGRVLAEAINADRDLPPFDRVMMDGYAVRSKDCRNGLAFTIRGSAMAGSPTQALSDEPFSAIPVMTGAPLPTGADAVIPCENVVSSANRVVIDSDSLPQAGAYIHRKGSDNSKGFELISEGTRLRSVEIGVAASSGYAFVRVRRRPRVIAIGTGDELVPVSAHPAPHQIRRSNALAVSAALSGLPILLSPPEHLSDNRAIEEARLQAAIESHDVVVLSGAVSKGQLDWIPSSLDIMGKRVFHGVLQRPGKPMGVWQGAEGALIFALPGNPVSTLVGVHRYVRPWLLKQVGYREKLSTVTLRGEFLQHPNLTLFRPARMDTDGVAVSVPINNSGDYSALTQSDGFVQLAPSENHSTANCAVPFYPWK